MRVTSDGILAKLDQWSVEVWTELLDPQVSIVLSKPACSLRGLDDGQLNTIRRLAKIGHAYICAHKIRLSEEKGHGEA